MKKVKDYLNVVHYCFYKAHYRSHLLANRINPFHLVHKLPFQKRRYEKLGIDIQKELDKAFGDKNYGLTVVVAGGMLWGGITAFFFSVLILFNLPVLRPYIFACAVLAGIISYFFVFKDDMYLEYFDKYEKWSKEEKRKYSWLTLASVIAVFLLFYLGLQT